VLNRIDWGEDRYPVASMTVTNCPGMVVLDRYITAAEPFCNPEVSSWITEVLSFIIPLMLSV
jgi:hypothetical protein